MSSASTADAVAAAAGPGRGHRVAEALLRFRELGIVLALAIVVTVTAIKNPRFIEVSSLQDILAGAAIIGLLAIGQTLVVVTRNVDLSCGSVVGLSAYATGVLFFHYPGVSPVLVFLLAAAVGLACGMINGAIVTIARVPSLVVTLGTLYVIRGADATWAGGNQINASSLPDWFNQIGFGTVLGLPYLGIILIGAAIVAAYCMRRFRTGARLLRHRLEPAGGAPRRHPGGAEDLPHLRDQRRHRRRRRGALAELLRLGRLDGRHRIRVHGDRRSGRRRRGHLRRQRQRDRRRARRHPAPDDLERPALGERLVELGAGGPGRAAGRRDRPRPGRVRCASRRRCAPDGAVVSPPEPGPRPAAPQPASEHGAREVARRLVRWESAWCCSWWR